MKERYPFFQELKTLYSQAITWKNWVELFFGLAIYPNFVELQKIIVYLRQLEV